MEVLSNLNELLTSRWSAGRCVLGCPMGFCPHFESMSKGEMKNWACLVWAWSSEDLHNNWNCWSDLKMLQQNSLLRVPVSCPWDLLEVVETAEPTAMHRKALLVHRGKEQEWEAPRYGRASRRMAVRNHQQTWLLPPQRPMKRTIPCPPACNAGRKLRPRNCPAPKMPDHCFHHLWSSMHSALLSICPIGSCPSTACCRQTPNSFLRKMSLISSD